EETFRSAVLLSRAVPASGALRPHLDAVLRDNPEIDFDITDFFDRNGDALNWRSVPTDARPAVRKELMKYQRGLALSPAVSAALTMMSRGYSSAWSIATVTEQQFIAGSGLTADQARLTYAKAKQQATSSASDYAAIFDVLKGGLNKTTVGNVDYPPLVNDLMQIDGLADLFGPQNYCDCEHCRSLLSP